jgi:3-mercaptopyruvate sulfurtransferase SseA
LILIFIGLVLIGGALGWVGFSYYQAGRDQPQALQSDRVDSANQAARIPYPDISRVSVQDARAALEIGNAVFLDVRGAEYYARSHIPGALSIPEETIAERLDELKPAEWIITYCT